MKTLSQVKTPSDIVDVTNDPVNMVLLEKEASQKYSLKSRIFAMAIGASEIKNRPMPTFLGHCFKHGFFEQKGIGLTSWCVLDCPECIKERGDK